MPYTEVLVSWEGKRGDVYSGMAGVLYDVGPDGDEFRETVTMVLVPEYAPDTDDMRTTIRETFYNRRNHD